MTSNVQDAVLTSSRPQRDLPVLFVAPDFRSFRVGDREISLSHSRMLRRVLEVLVARHTAHPGTPVTVEEFMRDVWPYEALPEAAGLNRVRVGIATLRKLGLDRHIETARRCYLLEPQVVVNWLERSGE